MDIVKLTGVNLWRGVCKRLSSLQEMDQSVIQQTFLWSL